MRSTILERRVFTAAVVLPACLWVLGCGAGPMAGPAGSSTGGGATPTAALNLAGHELVDLTYTFDESTLYWPTSPTAFELTVYSHGMTEGGWFYAANGLATPEHGGTHLDAPIHFAEGMRTADEVPVSQLIAPAVVIDVAAAAAANPDYALTVEDVTAWEAAHGRVPEGSIVLLRTGWGERWPDRLRYFGDDTPGDASNLHFPSYGAAAAELLVGERGVGVLGVDTASIDPGASQDFPVHRVAAAANVPGLENVARLERLPATGSWVMALPMKIGGGSGGPVRIVALIPR